MNLVDINKNQTDNEKGEEIDSDNCFIEGLIIELESALGFSLFKMVHNIIHENVNYFNLLIIFQNHRPIHINLNVILIY